MLRPNRGAVDPPRVAENPPSTAMMKYSGPERMITEHAAPVAGECVWLEVPRRINGKQQRPWKAIATGATELRDEALFAELRVWPMSGTMWRPFSRIIRAQKTVDWVHGMGDKPGRIVAGLTACIRAGSCSDVLRALGEAHGRVTVIPTQPPDNTGHDPLPDLNRFTAVPVPGVDVAFMTMSGADGWGRVLSVDEDSDPPLCKLAMFSRNDSGFYVCDSAKWICSTDISVAGLFFQMIALHHDIMSASGP